MRFWKFALVMAFLCSFLAFPQDVGGQSLEKPDKLAAKVLEDAGIGTDNKSLIAFLDKLSSNDAGLQQMEPLILEMGSGSFAAREKAAKKLLTLGPAALTRLREAAHHQDGEIARRAGQCVRRLEEEYVWVSQRAAVRLLLSRADLSAAQALIRFLPYSPDEQAKEDIWFGLYQMGKKDAGVLRLARAHLEDPMRARRALAGFLLARLGSAEQRQAVGKLLKDSQPEVRLRTAQGLLSARDAAGVPALIELLKEPAVELGWSAEELLFWLAGDEAAKETIGSATAASRRRSQMAWETWWDNGSRKIDWKQLEQGPRRPGLFLVCDRCQDDNEPNPPFRRIWLCGCDGKPRWQNEQVRCRDAELLPGNRVLLAEYAPKEIISERDLGNNLLRTIPVVPFTVWRLPNGNTQEWGNDQINPAGTRVSLRSFKKGEQAFLEFLGEDMTAEVPRLRNGNLLQSSYRQTTGSLNGIGIRLVLEEGRGHMRIGNGGDVTQYRVFLRTSPCVKEIQPDGTIVWTALTEGVVSRVRPCLGLLRLGFEGPARKRYDITPLLLAQMKDPRSYVRMNAIADLAAPPPQQAAKVAAVVVEALDDPDPWVRTAAEKTVRNLGSAAAHTLLKAVDDPRPFVARESYGGLVACKKDASPELLRELLAFFIKQTKDVKLEVRTRAINALGHFGPRSGMETEVGRILVTQLDNPDYAIRISSATAMEFSGIAPEVCVPGLIKAFEKKDPPGWRIWVTIGLGAYVDHPKVFPFLVQLLGHEVTDVRGSAAFNISKMGKKGKEAIPVLLQAIKDKSKDGSSLARPGIIMALMKTGTDSSEMVPIFRDLLLDKTCGPHVRAAAADALGQIGVPARLAIPALQITTNDPQPFVSLSAKEALKAIGK